MIIALQLLEGSSASNTKCVQLHYVGMVFDLSYIGNVRGHRFGLSVDGRTTLTMTRTD